MFDDEKLEYCYDALKDTAQDLFDRGYSNEECLIFFAVQAAQISVRIGVNNLKNVVTLFLEHYTVELNEICKANNIKSSFDIQHMGDYTDAEKDLLH